ncbi:MAG: T9SS type A sorting domain-containing protein [Bacteroidetes bacterium]|nr:T9SS type A sorting domain-containing protein [Bacteroidota bacterium]
MQKSFSCLVGFILFSFNISLAQFGNNPPFKVETEAIANTNTIGLHSFAFAQSGSKWLFIGGRTNGLHGFTLGTGFQVQDANNQMVVIDTTTWQTWYTSLNVLPLNIADPLRSTNMEYYQDGNYLYMIGGYGYDSIQAKNITFSTLTAIHIDSTINAVISGKTINAFIRQITDSRIQVCGGEMEKVANKFYLFFGHNYNGDYPDLNATQEYINQIKTFTIADDGTNLSISNYSAITDSVEFHRRDLTVAPIVNPDESFSIAAYAGVFKPNFKPFTHPIYVDSSSVFIDTAYNQVMSLYTCARVPMYDSATQNMYTVFLGGVSTNYYDETTQQLLYSAKIPFTDDVTVLTKYANGTTQETLLPFQLPALIGKNAKFIFNQSVSHYSNHVIKLHALSQRTHVGYFFGGIRASQPNNGVSVANDSIYRIFITPKAINSIKNIETLNPSLRIFPNPAKTNITISFHLSNFEHVQLTIYDVIGKKIKTPLDKDMNEGDYSISIDASDLTSNLYLCQLRTESIFQVIRFTVIK